MIEKIIILCVLLCSCKTTSQKKDDYSFLGKRVYKTVKWNQKIDTIKNYSKYPRYMMFSRNIVNDTIFSYEYLDESLILHRRHVGDKETTVSNRFRFGNDNGVYIGDIGKYRAFSGNNRRVNLYCGKEEKKVDFKYENLRVYHIKNTGKDTVVFLGYDEKARQFGFFKDKASYIIEERPSIPRLVYDMGAKNYKDLNSSSFMGFFDTNETHLQYTFERWNRLLYVNNGNSLLIKTIDSCELMTRKAYGGGFSSPMRMCDFNIVNVFVIDNYIITCPRKVVTDTDLYPFDTYDVKTGKYLYSMGYGIPYAGDKHLLYIADIQDSIVALYYLESIKDKLLQVSIPKSELIAHLKAFQEARTKPN